MFLADFHVHSTFSDGKHTIPDVVDWYGQRGFGAIAITDHLCESSTVIGIAASYLGCSLTETTFPLYTEILKSEAERAWQQYRMVVIPGVELTKNSISNHRSAHILALGVDSFLPADGDVKDICRAIRARGWLSVAAHPVWTRLVEKQTYHIWSRLEELRNEFDVWEVASGRHVFEEVKNAKLPMIASSDLHRKAQINSWKTLLTCERHPEAILEAIRKQDLDFYYYQEVVPIGDHCPPRSGALVSGYQPHGVGDLVYAQ